MMQRSPIFALLLFGWLTGLLGTFPVSATAVAQENQTADAPRIDEGAPAKPRINPGWDAERFPEHAVCYKSPDEIAAMCKEILGDRAVVSYEKPKDGSLRIVGTGHSFMAPAYRTLPSIVEAAGYKQPPMVTHTGGGVTGSARYKWEQENGIFQFDGRPVPKLLACIANAEWDVMLWGPYYHDRPVYYECWIDFCLKTNPDMKFYLMNAWPQIDQLRDQPPRSEKDLNDETLEKMSEVKSEIFNKLVEQLNKKYPDKVFVLPTCEAMLLAAKQYNAGNLPGVEGIHTLVGRKERSLWRDRIGHLGPGFETLEGYVFYATLYGRSPELIEKEVKFPGRGNTSNKFPAKFPSDKLDAEFRKIAWQAVLANPYSGVKDENGNGIGDAWE